MAQKHERTLIIVKPDALQRNLLGDIIQRFERKGLKIIGLRMISLDDLLLDKHYSHHKNKPFFNSLKSFMKSAPVVLMVLEGLEAVSAVRLITGATKGREADAGTIRGDFSMSGQCNIVHASDSPENAEKEIEVLFQTDDLFDYDKIDKTFVYGDDEL